MAFGYFIYSSVRTGSVDQGNKDLDYLIELKGQLNKNPVLSISLAICLFSMAGIPPLIGFFSKQFVLFSSIENGNNFLSIIAILVSVISASYYLKLIKITFFSIPDANSDQKVEIDNAIISLDPNAERGLPGLNQATQSLCGGLETNKNSLERSASNVHSYIIAILSFLILFFFLDPSILLNGTQLISLTIFNL